MYFPCSIETSQAFGGNNASEKYSGSKKKVQVVRINTQPAKTWDALPPAKKTQSAKTCAAVLDFKPTSEGNSSSEK